jgi:hypothetical protein
LLQAGLSAAHVPFTSSPECPNARLARLKLRAITALLHLLQPLARLFGRLGYVSTSRQKSAELGLSLPRPRTSTVWSELWRAPGEWLRSVEVALQNSGVVSLRGGDYDRWDLEVRGGRLGSARTLMTIEEHGGGRQLVRFRTWARSSSTGVLLIAMFVVLCVGAALDHAWISSAILGAVAATLVLRMVWECSIATAFVLGVVEGPENHLGSSSGADDHVGAQKA